MLVIEKLVEELNENPKAAIYVGGALERYPTITMASRFFSLFVDPPVAHACPSDTVSYINDLEKTYNYIGFANYAVFVPYADGQLDANIMHEIAFARYVNAKVYILSQEDLKMMSLCVDGRFGVDPEIVNEAAKKLLNTRFGVNDAIEKISKIGEKYYVKTN